MRMTADQENIILPLIEALYKQDDQELFYHQRPMLYIAVKAIDQEEAHNVRLVEFSTCQEYSQEEVIDLILTGNACGYVS